MLNYLVVKHLHMTCAALSGAGFLLRGFWMWRDSPMLQAKWVRIVPHMIDTLLLGSAITLAVISAQYPFQQAWLTAKVLGLLAYIGFGTVALKRGRTKGVRLAFLGLAIAAFAYIISVALTRNPYLWL